MESSNTGSQPTQEPSSPDLRDHPIPNLPPPLPSRARPTFDRRIQTVLSILSFLGVLAYWYFGGDFLPLFILLPICGQILARGIIAVCNLILHFLGSLARRRPVPIDLLTSFLIEVDTRIGSPLNPSYILVSGFVTLFLLNTPETLLGTLGTRGTDVRSRRTSRQQVELGPFGGAFNSWLYYTSGMLLMASRDPQRSYGEVAFKTNEDWVVPRKPTLWYREFARQTKTDSDREVRIYVPWNEVAVLRRRERSFQESSCERNTTEAYSYWITFTVCNKSGAFGFEMGGPDIKNSSGFFRLAKGYTNVRYWSQNGARKLKGRAIENEKVVNLPRFRDLWREMISNCFLNAMSFNRLDDDITIAERLAISSVVRIDGLKDPTGFSDPPLLVDAEVSPVIKSNISRWAVLTTFISVVSIVVVDGMFAIKMKVLSMELGQWMAIGVVLVRGEIVKCLPRYAFKAPSMFGCPKVMLESELRDFRRHVAMALPRVGDD